MNMTATTVQTRASASFGNVIAMTDARVARGQAAWSRIKATAAEQRELWREVGEALLVGRKANKADQKFSQWCKDHGFTFSDHPKTNANIRAAAMWMVTEQVPNDWEPTLSHPVAVQAQWRKEEKTSSLPPDLQQIEAEKVETIELDQRSAERVAKVINRAKANDEGSETAKRHVEALAKKHGTTPEKVCGMPGKVHGRAVEPFSETGVHEPLRSPLRRSMGL